MDIISNLPVEISSYIFSFLNSRDLYNCFIVSSKWRYLANCNKLWEKHCKTYVTEEEIKKAVSRDRRRQPFLLTFKSLHYYLRSNANENLSEKNNLGPLCCCARLFKERHIRHLMNWKNGSFRLGRLFLPQGEYNLVCSNTSLTICFYLPNIFRVFRLSPGGNIEYVRFPDISIPYWATYDSVQISSKYMTVASEKDTLLYRKHLHEYVFCKCYILHNDNLVTYDHHFKSSIEPSVGRDQSLLVAFISEPYIWFKTVSHIFVVNIENGLHIRISFDNAQIKHSANGIVAVWYRGQIKVFSISGHLMHHRQMRATICQVAFEETFALLCKNKNKTKVWVEWWDPWTLKRKVLKKVEEDSWLQVCGENVFILEVITDCYYQQVSAVHSASGLTHWTHRIGLPDSLGARGSTLFETISERFLFVHVPYLSSRKYHIIDINTGASLYTSRDIGGGNAYFFNEKVVIVLHSGKVRILNYI